MKVPYALPYIGEEEIQEVVSALRSNWLSKGPKTLEFEKAFSSLVDSAHAIGLSSCTAGLHIAQVVSGVGPGDEVITTPYTFVATVNTILHCGAKPVFADIDPVTLNIDPEQVERMITPKTKAIIPVHFAGYPCDMRPLLALADKYKLTVIEDAAHAVYTQYHGKPVGSISELTCFSFYATKNLSTGEGGMVTTNNPELADKLKAYSLHGMSKDAWNRYSDKGSWFYEVRYPGFKYNMTDLQAALGLRQLERLAHMQQIRMTYAHAYLDAFSQLEELVLPVDSPEHRHAWHLFFIRIRQGALTITRDEFIDLLKEEGIGTSVHFIPVPLHPYYQQAGYRIEDYPVAKEAYEGVISLPLYPGMTVEQVNYVIDAVVGIVKKYRR